MGPLRPESPFPCLAVKLEKGEGRASEPDPDPNSNPSSGSESESSVRPRRDVAAGSISGLSGLAAGPSNFLLPSTGPPRLRSVTKDTEGPVGRDGEGNTAAAATRAADATREIMSPPPPESVPGSGSSSFFDFDDFRLGRVGDHGLRTLSFRLGST